MRDSEQKGLKLVQKAEKKLTAEKGFFGSVFWWVAWMKRDDAAKYYKSAAIMFKIAKKWANAGEAFVKAAELQLKNRDRHAARNNFEHAAKCFKKTDMKTAVACLEKLIGLCLEVGYFYSAANHHQSIAELLEADDDLEKAIRHYEQAADYYEGEEYNNKAENSMLKMAALAAQLGSYKKAIEVYEKTAVTYLGSSLEYSANEYFFRAAVCHLCVDVLNCQQALNRFGNMSPRFRDSRECKLMKNLSSHVEKKNVDAFTETLKQYNLCARLDNWFTTLFLRVKKTMNVKGEIL